MALGSCYSCIKYLMFAFNFLFWLLGCAILGVGIWLRVDPNVSKYVSQEEALGIFHTLAYALITIGVIIMIIGFLGCCGAIRESQCMLGTFFLLLFIIFTILLGFGIWSVVEKDTMKGKVGEILEGAVKTYYNKDSSAKFMDTIQEEFHCCGANNAKDYEDNNQAPHQDIPNSCKSEDHHRGCKGEFISYVSGHLIVVAGIAIAIAIVLILGMIFSMVLCCALRDGEMA